MNISIYLILLREFQRKFANFISKFSKYPYCCLISERIREVTTICHHKKSTIKMATLAENNDLFKDSFLK